MVNRSPGGRARSQGVTRSAENGKGTDSAAAR